MTNVKLTIKRHPLIVMNAGASIACAKLERDFGFSCPTALLHLSAKIESATQAVVATHLPRLRPRYHSSDRGATFRVLEWYEEYASLGLPNVSMRNPALVGWWWGCGCSLANLEVPHLEVLCELIF